MNLQLISAAILVCLIYLSFRSLKTPGIALGLVWCIYAMEQVLQQGNAFFLSNGSFLNIFVAVIAAVGASKNILSGRISINNFPPVLVITIGLFLYALFSTFWAPDADASLRFFTGSLPYLIIFILAAPLCASDTAQIESAVQVIMYFGFLILLGLLFSTTNNRAIVLAEHQGEAVRGNPLAVATFAGHVVLAALFSIYSKKSNSLNLLIYITIAAFAMLTMARSGSRGQVVGVILAAFLWLPITAKVAAKRSTIIALLAAAIATLTLVYIVSNSDYASRWNAETLEHSTFGRLEMASDLLVQYNNGGPGIWIFGLGSSASYALVGFYPHIVLPEVLAEEGLIGLFMFFLIIYITMTKGFQWIRSPDIDRSSRVYLGLLLSFFTFTFALSFKQGSMLGSSQFFGSGAIIGWFLFSLQKEKSRSKRRQMARFSSPLPQLRR